MQPYMIDPAAGYSALQRDAERRLERMERRAAEYAGMPGGGDVPGPDGSVPPRGCPLRASARHMHRHDTRGGDSELAERTLLLLLICVLYKEKADPCLIAALVYLLL